MMEVAHLCLEGKPNRPAAFPNAIGLVLVHLPLVCHPLALFHLGKGTWDDKKQEGYFKHCNRMNTKQQYNCIHCQVNIHYWDSVTWCVIFCVHTKSTQIQFHVKKKIFTLRFSQSHFCIQRSTSKYLCVFFTCVTCASNAIDWSERTISDDFRCIESKKSCNMCFLFKVLSLFGRVCILRYDMPRENNSFSGALQTCIVTFSPKSCALYR